MFCPLSKFQLYSMELSPIVTRFCIRASDLVDLLPASSCSPLPAPGREGAEMGKGKGEGSGSGDVVQLCLTFCNPKEPNSLWTVAREASLSMRFSWQEYRNGLPFPSPGDLPKPGIELRSPALQADASPSEPPGKTNR